jgi:hypothetical protein
VAVAVAEPLLPPKQSTFTEAVILAVGEPALGTFTVAVAVQPFASVTVTTYDPAASPVAVAVVCTGLVFHEYEYGVVPPLAVTVAEPFGCPHVDCVNDVVRVNAGG